MHCMGHGPVRGRTACSTDQPSWVPPRTGRRSNGWTRIATDILPSSLHLPSSFTLYTFFRSSFRIPNGFVEREIGFREVDKIDGHGEEPEILEHLLPPHRLGMAGETSAVDIEAARHRGEDGDEEDHQHPRGYQRAAAYRGAEEEEDTDDD